MDLQFIQPNGDAISLFNRDPLISAEKIEQVQELLGMDEVHLTVVSSIALDFSIGGYINIFGKKYTMNQSPKSGEKNALASFAYDLVMEGTQYELRRPVFFNTDVSGYQDSNDYPLTGNIEIFIDTIIENCNRVFGAGKWVKGEIPVTGTETIPFSTNNCLAALQQICEKFKQEFDIIQTGPDTRILHIRQAGEILGHTFKYGRGQGLYKLKRETVTDADIFTRIYPQGSTQNLKPGYRGAEKRLKIEGDYIDDAAAIAKYGIHERVVTYDDIKPHRTGGVSSVPSYDTFTDASMDFDLNGSDSGGYPYILPTVSPKIHFNEGNLAGYEFEVSKYVHATKTFTLIPIKDERGEEMPSSSQIAFQIQPGDKYVILDINMPDSYIATAEAELYNRGFADLQLGKVPPVRYSLEIDEQFLFDLYGNTEYYNVFSIGDYVQVFDEDLFIDKSTRIIKFTRDGRDQYKYNLTLDDTYETNILVTIIENQKEIKQIIQMARLNDINRIRNGILTTYELFNNIFDTDNYFDGSRIKPLSIETGALVVGFKSQQYTLQDIVFQPNYENQKNTVHASAGQLIHYTMFPTTKVWNITETTVTIPDDNKRFIYAKVLKSGNTGVLIFSPNEITVDQDPNYYHFMVGMLNSVIDGMRWVSFSYGVTTIIGGQIKTGTIASFDGLTSFNLETGIIQGKIRFRDYKGNYRELSDIGADMEGFFAAAVTTTPLDGMVTAWFQSLPPDTWPSGEDPQHEGDSWFDIDDLTVKRFVSGSWVPETDPDIIEQYTSTFVRVGPEATRIRLFTEEPSAPYNQNDLWMSTEGLRRSIVDKVMGNPFDINDWVEPFNFDNTETAIDAGITTSGIIQLAGDKNTITAGISGRGNLPTSIRIFAGASTLNMASAPFRVNQRGEVFGRRRIEVEGLDVDGITYIGQAGLCGQVESGDGDIRIYAGKNYANRETAYFRVNKNGFVWMERAQIGNMRIQDGGLTNRIADGTFFGEASIVLRNDTRGVFVGIGTNMAPASTGLSVLARFENHEVTAAAGHIKYAAFFSAKGGTGIDAENFAIFADEGISLFGEVLTNGERTRVVTLPPSTTVTFDPTLYNHIIISYGAGAPGVRFATSDFAHPLRNGKEVTIQSTNNATNFFIIGTIRSNPTVSVNAGSTITLKYSSGNWYIKSHFDNAF